MVEVTLEAMAGIALATAGFIVGYMRNMRKDICRDINGKHADLKTDIAEVKENTRLSKEEAAQHIELVQKLNRELDQRLSRIEGRNLERDRNPTHRDSLAHNSQQKEVYSNG